MWEQLAIPNGFGVSPAGHRNYVAGQLGEGALVCHKVVGAGEL